MIFTLEFILDEIKDFAPVSNQQSWKNKEIPGVFYLSGEISRFCENGIYVCTPEELSILKTPSSSVIFFIVSEDPELFFNIKNHCFILQKASSVMQVINRYMQILSDYSYWDKQMHLDIINSYSLKTMLDYGSRIIDYPIQVYDPSFRILETSSLHKINVDDFRLAIELGYTPPDFIANIQQKNFLSKIQDSERCIVGPGIKVPTHNNIYRAHKINGQLLGYSCIFCGDAVISQGFLDQAELFFQNLDFYFKENQKQLVLSKYMYESFLVSLMTSRFPADSKILLDRAQLVHLPLKGQFILIRLDFDTEEGFLLYLCRLIQKYLPEYNIFVYENTVYLLIIQKSASKTVADSAVDIIRYLKNMLSSYTFSSCISNTFYELPAIYDAYQLCAKLEAMRTRLSLEPGIYSYQDWQAVLHLLQYGEDFDVKTLYMPELCKIMLHDTKQHTHYLETLQIYFEKNCDLKKTADTMGMHRNTIANRIEKIREIFHIDLSDFETCYRIYGSLLLMKYTK